MLTTAFAIHLFSAAMALQEVPRSAVRGRHPEGTNRKIRTVAELPARSEAASGGYSQILPGCIRRRLVALFRLSGCLSRRQRGDARRHQSDLPGLLFPEAVAGLAT